ncbi:MAG: efflux transporter outer membrane subunit [Nitrospiraceae bacterium]|nr:efflux transporter outer membrane subunit [Nitrospiraceae bacterium]
MMFSLSACTVGPDYVRPEVETGQAYKETEGWRKARPNDALRRGAWWELYGDPLLDDLERQVNISNQGIAVAEAQYRQARALGQAARSGYYPKIAAGVSASRSRRPGGVSGAATGATVSDYLLPLDASWEIDLWGRVRRGVESAEAGFQASGADLESVRLSIQAELAADYFLLRSLDSQKMLLDGTVAAFEKSLQLTQNRYAAGIVSRADLLQADTQLKSTQAQAIDVGVQRAQYEHAIAVLIGKPAGGFSLAAAPLAVTPPAVPAGIPSELLERRPDIAAAERRAASASGLIGVAEAAYYPSITLSAGAGFESSHLSHWLSWPSRLWSVGSAVSETVFEGGLRRAETDQARAVYDAAVASYRQTVLSAFQEVEDNLAALRILRQEAAVQDEAVKSAQQALTVTTNQYKAGTVSYLDVVTTQTIVLANERAAITILGRRIAASVQLIKALGGGWHATDPDTGKK